MGGEALNFHRPPKPERAPTQILGGGTAHLATLGTNYKTRRYKGTHSGAFEREREEKEARLLRAQAQKKPLPLVKIRAAHVDLTHMMRTKKR